jgi:hypothetical protein
MAGPPLLGLKHKVDARVLHRLAHAVGFVPDDRVHIFGRDDAHSRLDHVLQQRLSPDFM